MSAARKLRRQQHESMILCARIGHTGNAPIPPGYQTADCSLCGSAVWVHPRTIAVAKTTGHVPGYLCNVCARS